MMRPAAACAVAAAMALLSSGCAAPELEFADWVFDVPEGTPIKEYAPVPLEQRTEVVLEVVDDLVIGGDPSNPDTAFYRPTAVVAAANGNIFVVERGNQRIQMFGPDGAFLKTLGAPGQGPGELQLPMAATIAGDRLLVFDMQNRRFSVWTEEGVYVADHATPLSSAPTQMAGLADGRTVILSMEMDLAQISAGTMPTPTYAVSSYTAAGEQLTRFVQVTSPPMPSPTDLLNDNRARIQYLIDSGANPRPAFTVGSEEIVYVSPISEYQVLAMTPAGEAIWALRVAWPRRPYSQRSKEIRVQGLGRNDPEIEVEDFEWPEHDNALSSSMLSDGHGRLYVFPLVEARVADPETDPETGDADDRPRGRPVDVFSPQGDLLVSGLATGSWSYARGDFVYRLSRQPDTDETVVIRSRLVLSH